MAASTAPSSIAFLTHREAPPTGAVAHAPAAASPVVEAPPVPTPAPRTRADEVEIPGGE